MELGKGGRISVTAAEALAVIELFVARGNGDEPVALQQARLQREVELRKRKPNKIAQQLGNAASGGMIRFILQPIEDELPLSSDARKQIDNMRKTYENWVARAA